MLFQTLIDFHSVQSVHNIVNLVHIHVTSHIVVYVWSLVLENE